MARSARIQYEGAFYHVMNRGNERKNIFLDNKDRKKFYEILGAVEEKHGIMVYAFVLMSNHYHILLETPFSNLSHAIQKLNGDYALYFNRRYSKPGHLFQGRFKAMLVEKEVYLLELSRYIHLNPFRAGITKSPEKYKWSSLSYYIKGKAKFPFTLHWEWMLSTFEKKRSTASTKYLEFIRDGIKDVVNPGLEASGGWILGRDGWVKKIIKKWGGFSSRELSGVKPLKIRIPVSTMEKLVCRAFDIDEKDLKKATYNNVARMAIIYLTVNYCGIRLEEAGQIYGGISYSAISKATSRFVSRLNKDKALKNKINQILSNVKMRPL